MKKIQTLIKRFIQRVQHLIQDRNLTHLYTPLTKEAYYECWGCGRSEFLRITPKVTEKDLIDFWRRWGTTEVALKFVFAGDGTYTTESFCPKCREIIDDQAGQYRFGYLASELAPLLRGEHTEGFPH